MNLVFLLEEESMKALLEKLLPKILSEKIKFRCIAHEGKSDLEKSIPRKLNAWLEPKTQFIVVRDKDQADCIKVKEKLKSLCIGTRHENTIIRIACHELESWFLGDLLAIEKAFNLKNLSTKQNTEKFRDPDKIPYASKELEKLVKNYRKTSGAEKIADYMNIEENRSKSFNCFIRTIQKFNKDVLV